MQSRTMEFTAVVAQPSNLGAAAHELADMADLIDPVVLLRIIADKNKSFI